MVMASGSGLDPHISIRNARYQLERVVAARAATAADRPWVRQQAEAILQAAAFQPLGGLAGGEPLLNVLDVNRQLDRELRRTAR
jgi:K+-transporting ATPase ATPase C chain